MSQPVYPSGPYPTPPYGTLPGPTGPTTMGSGGPVLGGPLGPVPGGPLGPMPGYPYPGLPRRVPPMTTGKVVAISLVTSILVCAVFFLTWILLLDHPVGGPVSPVGAGIPASAVVPAPPGGALPEPAGGEVVVAPGGAPVVAPVPAAAPVPVVAPLSSPVAAGASVPAAPPASTPAPPAGAAPVSGEAATASPVELLVPAVRGSSQARAEATLRAKGYRPVVRYAAYDEDVRPLAVTGQRPAAGTPLPAGSTVTIIVNPDGE